MSVYEAGFCEGTQVVAISGASTFVMECAGARCLLRSRNLNPASLSLICSAALLMSGCSNEPLSPQGALWSGASTARAASATVGNASHDMATKTARRVGNGGGWGPYSGRRGQTEPPATINYAFKGDPDASPTFAGGPGQM
ncbi:hypothetical protein HYPDE_33593 [Hyphomicrobium denitrificans 1NES1]|uniref:Uncharacterized protein n=1 Tax=Hyphomicrobium denitrificans 1NES1 TaxID=670307 RepID=N0BCY1_9HYPH|nr:hypothetical protein HYPDE_33593 [Hyphomicrobium denitrificans 1NES1]